ncbi:SIMPL domain-containing protein [soil metagenome]
MKTVSLLRQIVMLSALATTPALRASAQVQASASAPTLVPVLSTSGQGDAKVTPDRASVMLNVQTRATTAAAAASDNATRTRAVLDAVARLGLSRDQLSTEGYTVYPEMQYDKNGAAPRVSGYVVTNTVRAETKRPEQAGAIVDAALGAGANMVNSLTFYASSIDEARRQAVTSAVASARADAEAMARAAGGTLGGLLELSTGGPTVPPRPMYDMAVRAKSAMQAEPTPVNPGQQTVTVYVTARWRFVPPAGGM